MEDKPKFDKNKYVQEYHKQNYDRLEIILPKGKKATIKNVAKMSNESVNSLVNRAIDEELKKNENNS